MTREAPQRALNALLRGVAHDASEDIRDGWQRMTAFGDTAVPIVCEKLRKTSWSDYQGQTHARYLTILLMILVELDVDVCERELDRLAGSELHGLHARTVSLISERLREETCEFEFLGVSIRIDSQLSDLEDIRKRITRWMQVPPEEAFNHLQSIDVVPMHPSFDYLGLHSYRFSGIVITWLPEGRRGLMRRLELLNTQGTLYHEIGHSFHQHSEPGQVAEQESEANIYQRAMLRRAYPVMTFCLRPVFVSVFFLRRLITRLMG